MRNARRSGAAACGHGVDRALGDERRDRASRNASGRRARSAHRGGRCFRTACGTAHRCRPGSACWGLAHRGAKRRIRRVAGLLQRAYDVSTQGARNRADLAGDGADPADGRAHDRPNRLASRSRVQRSTSRVPSPARPGHPIADCSIPCRPRRTPLPPPRSTTASATLRIHGASAGVNSSLAVGDVDSSLVSTRSSRSPRARS